jgi:DNA-binding transcriptional ArsR family regulator
MAARQAGGVAAVAAAIGEPARARMLMALLDGRARTSTELAALAGVSASTASSHLWKLETGALVAVAAQGRHRYYTLADARVAAVLESMSVLAAGSPAAFAPRTPAALRTARSCYDHLAGTLGVRLHDRLVALGWLRGADSDGYELTSAGERGLTTIGVDCGAARATRRRFAYRCLDWSERRPHVGGALAAAILRMTLQCRWLSREAEGRALAVTPHGRRELARRFGVTIEW